MSLLTNFTLFTKQKQSQYLQAEKSENLEAITEQMHQNYYDVFISKFFFLLQNIKHTDDAIQCKTEI